MLSFGIVGLPMVGKTTVFNLVTGGGAETSRFMTGKTGTNVGMARVRDPRVDFLSDLFKPRRTVYAQIQCSDVPGLVRGASEGQGVGNQFLEGIREADLLVHVLRAFNNPNVPHLDGEIDPVRDLETVSMELLFADMELLEKRVSRIKGGKKITREAAFEMEVLQKCLAGLENETPLHRQELAAEERAALRHYNFLTEKPVILVVNTDEEQFKSRSYPGRDALEKAASARGLKTIEICGEMELEISRLSPEDREIFLADLGVGELGSDRLVRTAYDQLGLISFFTVGEDEVKAWTIRQGTDAKRAAGKIHSDIERGFIRAEVVAYKDLYEQGSMAGVKEKGLARLEGKDYIVEDGDIINFRFNV
ncbi:redox-regulated ATPase YchF [Desulfofundulus thermobenzoicus]|uniref:Ribosome-binding ATPase YchF n=1 Tax=Desulfofundulus thermobenzoicus TaxID=29376 RepID=A0A6N7IRK0_9FIRM|nr:redox-regulated ATPase YchF [Desulfofundulus thermobenzoicus]MQL52541.1 redox-regulated ATPase YchF [Desulfofundulus thermobenzoicus]